MDERQGQAGRESGLSGDGVATPSAPHVAWADRPPAPGFFSRRRAILAIGTVGVLLAVAAASNLNLYLIVREHGDYAVGECLNRAPGPDPQAPLEVRSCDEPHLFETIGLFQIPRTATTMEDVTEAGLETCLDAFRSEIGSNFKSQTELALKYLVWPPETWKDGHTTAGCAVYRPDESPLLESVRRR